MGGMDDHTVAGRVVAVLDAVADLGDAATLAALTRSTGIPKPTVRRIAGDLVARNLLERCDDGYRLGQHLLELGLRAAERHGLRNAATPYIQDLFARTGEVVWVSAASETTYSLVDMAFGANRAEELRRRIWPTVIRRPVFLATAAGRVLLADRPDLAERLQSRPLRPLTRYTVTSWPQVAAALNVVRDTGTAIEHDQVMLGYSCIAAGLRGPDRSLIGMIGVTGHTGNFIAKRVTRPLLAAASDIARILATKHGSRHADSQSPLR
jgi:DNA-binding IclR family transcriptional regulator